MTEATAQSVASELPALLYQRLEALGVTVVSVCVDGQIVVPDTARRLERLLVWSPASKHAAAQYFDTLQADPGQAIAVLPGVWLTALPRRRRRSFGENASGDSLVAAMFIGPEFLESEAFFLICDQQQIDRQATLGRIDHGTLVVAGEAQRLATMIACMHEDLTELDRRWTDVQKLSTQLGESYEELSLLYKLSTSMAVNESPLHFLSEVCRELREVVGLRWMAMMLADDQPSLNELAGRLVVAGDVNCDTAELKDLGRQLLERQPADGTPSIIDDTRDLDVAPLTRLARRALIVSLVREGKTFGILFGGDKLDDSPIGSVDSKLCNSLANSMSIFLQNAMLYEDMQAMFMGTLHALSSSIDAKDSYTRGHSERVALVSRMLGEESGLDPAAAERAYIAGLLHDVGKIGVPEAVLSKPGRLTPEEFELIKAHPATGARILQGIRQMDDLVPGVLHHHERWDGNGYPEQLAGEDIPLFGRLISLADAFDAMSSSRTYRQAMPHERVMAEIKSNAGTQFDPKLVDILVSLDLAPVRDLLAEHQRMMAVQAAAEVLS